jgi:dTDP-D-glucose 4,6-dehydratase
MKYDITIQATITKTYTIEAEDEDTAIQIANESFDVLEEDHTYENYEQDTLEVCLSDDQEAELTRQKQPVEQAIKLLDRAITAIYNIEGDQYQDAYDQLQIIFDQLQKVNNELQEATA